MGEGGNYTSSKYKGAELLGSETTQVPNIRGRSLCGRKIRGGAYGGGKLHKYQTHF